MAEGRVDPRVTTCQPSVGSYCKLPTARHPIEYPWSSHAANADGKHVAWLTPHGEYLALGSDEEKCRTAYRGLFASELDLQLLREICISTHGGYAIGSTRFRNEIEGTLRTRATLQSPSGPGSLRA